MAAMAFPSSAANNKKEKFLLTINWWIANICINPQDSSIIEFFAKKERKSQDHPSTRKGPACRLAKDPSSIRASTAAFISKNTSYFSRQRWQLLWKRDDVQPVYYIGPTFQAKVRRAELSLEKKTDPLCPISMDLLPFWFQRKIIRSLLIRKRRNNSFMYNIFALHYISFLANALLRSCTSDRFIFRTTARVVQKKRANGSDALTADPYSLFKHEKIWSHRRIGDHCWASTAW